MFRGTIEVDAHALAVVMAHYDIGQPHQVLLPEPMFLRAAANDEALRRAKEQFTGYGLVEGDRLNEQFWYTLNAIARPEIEYYGWFQVRGTTTGVLAAKLHREAFVAVREATTVRMRPIRGDNLVPELVSELPSLRAATFKPISVRLSEATAALSGESGNGYSRSLGSGLTAPLQQLKDLTKREEMGGAQLSVAVRDESGNRFPCEYPVHIVDNPEGRVLNIVTKQGGDAWLLVIPGNPQDIDGRLRQVRAALPRA